jgi:hypothetical protein
MRWKMRKSDYPKMIDYINNLIGEIIEKEPKNKKEQKKLSENLEMIKDKVYDLALCCSLMTLTIENFKKDKEFARVFRQCIMLRTD